MSQIASELRSLIRSDAWYSYPEFAKAALQFITRDDHSVFDTLPPVAGKEAGINHVMITTLVPPAQKWTEENHAANRFKVAIWKHAEDPFYREAAVKSLAADSQSLYQQAVAGEDPDIVSFLGRMKEAGMDPSTIAAVAAGVGARFPGWSENWFESLSGSAPVWRTGLESLVWECPDEEFAVLALTAGRGVNHLWEAVTRFRPSCAPHFIANLSKLDKRLNEKVVLLWIEIIGESGAYDAQAVEWLSTHEDKKQKLRILGTLLEKRPAAHLDRFLGFIHSDHSITGEDVFKPLAAHAPGPALFDALTRHLAAGKNHGFGGAKVMAVAAGQILGEARDFFELFLDDSIPPPFPDDLKAIVENAPPEADDIVYQITARSFEADKDNIGRREWYWGALRSRPSVAIRFRDDFIRGLADARVRSGAKSLLKVALGDSGVHELLDGMWNSKDEKLRVVAIRSLAEDASETDKQKLLHWLAGKPSRKLSGIIHELLAKLGVAIPDDLVTPPASPPLPAGELRVAEPVTGFQKFETWVAANGKRLRFPKVTWCDPESLPPVVSTDGAELSKGGVRALITLQAKQKETTGVPEAADVFAEVDRAKTAAFANAVVEGFLNSDQAASDRWALALGGLLGDNRIITLLLPRINEWCENSRHKLAEHAAQAISLLPGNEPLMVLDTLSNRYRSKFKNVGKACAAAFNAAATARGITTDELGDLVVPDFGFDAEGIRRFDWDGGGASAELGADFKLSWFDPETDKAWKALPAAAPDDVKDEVKTLGKLLREAVKAQNSRLEMMLVRQRRWPVARWRELFENHPLLRSFASNLVWGVYDPAGKLLRTFRRYPNGILADAAGELEELPETDTSIGMVHPLELEQAPADAWRAHLARFKVKPPFPQLDRPVELVDPLHGNRREITTSRDKQLSAGTFRSRAEKRGWIRGSVVDAGGISSYYKVYPGAGIEVILPTENLWISCDPMETITLGGAWFVKAGSVERGSYTYDEPRADDSRVLRFDQIPAVVWSETISDLKAIVGETTPA